MSERPRVEAGMLSIPVGRVTSLTTRGGYLLVRFSADDLPAVRDEIRAGMNLSPIRDQSNGET